jgi:anti-anti-sigma factor
MRMLTHDGVGVVELSDSDFRQPGQLEDAFQSIIGDMQKGALVIDLSRVTHIMSLGVAVLVAAQGLALIHKAHIAFAGAQQAVLKILSLCGADKAITLYESVATAVTALKKSARHKAVAK